MNNENKCPSCGGTKIIKYGHRRGKQNHICKDCNRQFVENNAQKLILEGHKALIANALLERVALLGICRIFNVSLSWLLWYSTTLGRLSPEDLGQELPKDIKKVDLVFEMDELCTYIGKKKNKVWVWMVLHRPSRQIIAFVIGDHSAETFQKLWDKIPAKYKTEGVFYTDMLRSYGMVIPASQHCPQKKRGATNHISVSTALSEHLVPG